MLLFIWSCTYLISRPSKDQMFSNYVPTCKTTEFKESILKCSHLEMFCTCRKVQSVFTTNDESNSLVNMELNMSLRVMIWYVNCSVFGVLDIMSSSLWLAYSLLCRWRKHLYNIFCRMMPLLFPYFWDGCHEDQMKECWR